jgi:hypothetical protein
MFSDIRYNGIIDPGGDRWDRCANVLSRRDMVERPSKRAGRHAANETRTDGDRID